MGRKKTPLICKDFEKYLIERNEEENNYSYRFKLENGYVASVIKFEGSYGYQDDLFELAIILNDCLCCDTPITDDVLGYLTNDDVLETLDKIRNLPKDDSMKSAEEMFAELGFDKTAMIIAGCEDLYFRNKVGDVIVFGGEIKAFRKQKIGDYNLRYITMPELRAIIKQCKELGWLDEY